MCDRRVLANSPQPKNTNVNVHHSIPKVTFAFAFPGLRAVCSNSPPHAVCVCVHNPCVRAQYSFPQTMDCLVNSQTSAPLGTVPFVRDWPRTQNWTQNFANRTDPPAAMHDARLTRILTLFCVWRFLNRVQIRAVLCRNQPCKGLKSPLICPATRLTTQPCGEVRGKQWERGDDHLRALARM